MRQLLMHFSSIGMATLVACFVGVTAGAAPQGQPLSNNTTPAKSAALPPVARPAPSTFGSGGCPASCNVIDFEGLGNNTVIGTIPGTPSVTFGPSWLALIDGDVGGSGNFANEPSASTVAYFLQPADPITFSQPVRFVEVYFTAAAQSVPVTLTAFDGPNGTGNVVDIDFGDTVGTSYDGAPCSGDPSGDFCLWDVMTLTSPTNNIRSVVLGGAVANYFAFDNMTFCVSGDMDGDGLLDDWETCGIDYDQDGMIDFDLPALGADPAVKDIFIEVDAMAGRAPSATTLANVTSAFAAHGIRLHPLLDETSVSVASWPAGFANFDVFKAAHFGTAAERALPDWATKVRPAKFQAFRYCVFADQYGGGGSSGQAEIGGNDFYVTLGHSSWGSKTTDPNYQAGTFMHELGHTLGLLHGGPDSVNCKPNYHSVMNYVWQLPNLPLVSAYWALDYANSGVSSLDESNLSEASGIGGLAGSRVWCGPSPVTLFSETGSVDWNGDGDKTDIGVARDLNRISFVSACAAASPGQTLTTQNDWAVLDLNFRDSPDFADGVHIHLTSVEITGDDDIAMSQACAPPARFCIAKTDSVGCTPQISGSGSLSLSGPDDLIVRVDGMPAGRRGALAWGHNEATLPFAGGTLCVSNPLVRGPMMTSAGSGACGASMSFAFSHAYSASQGLTAGSVVYAQAWYRDPGASEPDNLGLSDGWAFALCP